MTTKTAHPDNELVELTVSIRRSDLERYQDKENAFFDAVAICEQAAAGADHPEEEWREYSEEEVAELERLADAAHQELYQAGVYLAQELRNAWDEARNLRVWQ